MAELQDLQPATVESNMFLQFDVQQKEEPVPGRRPIYQYVCLLAPCFEQDRILKSLHGWQNHRFKVHKISEEQNKHLPNGWEIHEWVENGKPRPYEVPVKPKPEKKPSLRERLLNNQPGMAELQPATLESNIYEQFDVRYEDGRALYICLLPPCFEEELGFANHLKWQRHRKKVHQISGEENLPSGWEIRVWVDKKKPRPYDVPVKEKKRKPEPEILEQVGVKVTDGKERFFCLLECVYKEKQLC